MVGRDRRVQARQGGRHHTDRPHSGGEIARPARLHNAQREQHDEHRAGVCTEPVDRRSGKQGGGRQPELGEPGGFPEVGKPGSRTNQVNGMSADMRTPSRFSVTGW
jgi:hypothetical protein